MVHCDNGKYPHQNLHTMTLLTGTGGIIELTSQAPRHSMALTSATTLAFPGGRGIPLWPRLWSLSPCSIFASSTSALSGEL
jgi:hypothetical protein